MKNLVNLGQLLTKVEQKLINGGTKPLACIHDYCASAADCPGSCACIIDEAHGNNYCT